MARKRGRSNAARATPELEKNARCAEPVEKTSKKAKKSAAVEASKPKVDPLDEKAKQKDDTQSAKVVAASSESSGAGAPKKKNKKKSKNKAASAKDATTDKKAAKTKGSEIDDLFATLKTTKQQKSIEEQQQKLAEEEAARREKSEKDRLQEQIKKLEAQNTNSTAVGLNPDPRPVRYDEDGLPIYSEASLQMGKGGNTKDCPFDCWCCF